MQGLRLVIGDNDRDFVENAARILKQRGYSVLSTDTSGTSLLRNIRRMSPDIVLVDVELKGTNGFEIADIIEREWIAPCIMLIRGSPSAYSYKLQEKMIYSYMQKPIEEPTIDYIIENAYFNFKKIKELDRKLQERKIIEKAKGMLIDRYNLSEDKAFEYIRSKSMDYCTSLYNTSIKIIQAIEKKNIKNNK